ncbi:MAG: hypothetical protein IJA32_15520 [Lachnospiraceae bacterium]|nr:hypothetical protein [Lachnospiraceae bacterium]
MKKVWRLLGLIACMFLTACTADEMEIGSTTSSAAETQKEEIVWKEIQFHDVVFQVPEEYETEITSKEVMQLAKTQNSSLTLRYECNQEKNMTKEYALGEYAATKMLEIAGKYPQAVFVESSIIDTEYGYYLKLSYEMMVNEKQVAYQIFYPMMECYDLVIECFDAKDYEGTSYLETAENIAQGLVIKEQTPKKEQETEDKVTLATEVEMQN